MSENIQEILQKGLEDIAIDARKLPWYSENPWKTNTHIWIEKEMPVIDLHATNVKLTQKILKLSVRLAEKHEFSSLCFITGIGINSIGDATLKNVVLKHLGEIAIEKQWGFHPLGPGRFVVIIDPDRAPPIATGQLPKMFWYGVGGFILLFFYVLIFR
jgi:hypothetical protein